MPIPVCISGPGLVWKKHHGHKVGLKKTSLRGHHPSPWTSESLKLDLRPRFDKNTSVLQYGCVYTAPQQVVFRYHDYICAHVCTTHHKFPLYSTIIFVYPNLCIHYETFVSVWNVWKATEPLGEDLAVGMCRLQSSVVTPAQYLMSIWYPSPDCKRWSLLSKRTVFYGIK